MLAGQADKADEETFTISDSDAAGIVAAFGDASDHRFSIIFIDGPHDGQSEIGDRHPTIVDQGGPVDGWAETMRDKVWEPLNLGVSMQWIILGMFVGVAMGSAGAQARSMFSQLVPETRTSEFFGFFGFLGKSAAMIGTFLYGIESSAFDSRVAILTITIVILAGTYLTSKVDLEEGIRVAEEEDEESSGSKIRLGVFHEELRLVQTVGSGVLLVYTIILWGLPIAPALAVFDLITEFALTDSVIMNYIVYGLTTGVCFMVYILSLLFFSGMTQRLIHVRIPEDKIVDKLESWNTVRWAICAHLHRCTHPVLVHTIPSPICNAYYRLAGAKLGKGVQINTINLNDPSAVTVGDNVVIGGRSVINGHLVEKGH